MEFDLQFLQQYLKWKLECPEMEFSEVIDHYFLQCEVLHYTRRHLLFLPIIELMRKQISFVTWQRCSCIPFQSSFKNFERAETGKSNQSFPFSAHFLCCQFHSQCFKICFCEFRYVFVSYNFSLCMQIPCFPVLTRFNANCIPIGHISSMVKKQKWRLVEKSARKDQFFPTQ